MWALPVAFYFSVYIGTDEVLCKEVSGLTTEMELETISEAGQNAYPLQLPKQMKHPNLVLKQALLPKDCAAITWIKGILEGDFINKITPKQVIVNLMGQDKAVLYTWTCENAFPVKWEVDSLDAEKNNVLMETLEFAYSSLKRS